MLNAIGRPVHLCLHCIRIMGWEEEEEEEEGVGEGDLGINTYR
jgi:hypothetical protein